MLPIRAILVQKPPEQYFFSKNPAPSLFTLHDTLPSLKNQRISTSGSRNKYGRGDKLTNRQTDGMYFRGPSLRGSKNLLHMRFNFLYRSGRPQYQPKRRV